MGKDKPYISRYGLLHPGLHGLVGGRGRIPAIGINYRHRLNYQWHFLPGLKKKNQHNTSKWWSRFPEQIKEVWVQRRKQGRQKHFMWNDTLPVCENTGWLSPRLIYLSASLEHQPVSWQHSLASHCARGIAVGGREGGKEAAEPLSRAQGV